MALEQITMPKLGESVTEGSISSWLVKPGQQVEKYQPLAEVLTDKVMAEIPSSFTGVLKERLVSEDETVSVGTVICTIETVAVVTGVEIETSDEQVTSSNRIEEKGKPKVSSEKKARTMGGRFSPAVLKLALDHQIDLSQVRGTGFAERITRKDLLAIVEMGGRLNTLISPTEVTQSQDTTNTGSTAAVKSIPKKNRSESDSVEIAVDGVRKAIAKHMVESKQTIPHAWMMVEVDATNLVSYRNEMKEQFRKEHGYKLSYFPFFLKAVAQALKEFPLLNSSWEGDKVIQHQAINLSIAIAANDLLYVPVIKAVDEKSIKGLAREISELARKAETGKFVPEDMSGGTFTVNSTGSFGSVQSMGIINHPQAAILQVEAIVKRPLVINNMIAIRDQVNLCLSIDHRLLDGRMAGAFLKVVKEKIEGITKENTSIY